MDEHLSKWLDGELTDDELIELIGREEAMKYIQIVGEVDNWVPDHSDHLLDPKVITSRPKAKTRTIRPWFGYAAAAVILLAIVSYMWLLMGDSTVTHSTMAGEVRMIELPDGVSSVTLAPDSEISWNEEDWKESLAMAKPKKLKRKVKLKKGKVLFKVAKGGPFRVESQSGSVEVLGTTFEVEDFEDGMSVICFEGKVRATSESDSQIISGGEGFLFYEGNWSEKQKISEDLPSWISNETKFRNAPLTQVIKSIEKLYGVSVKPGEVKLNRRFTGTIPNDKMDIALKIIFGSLDIDYSIKGSVIYLSE